MTDAENVTIARFGVTAERGFLPREDPIARLPSALAEWDELASNLPKLMATGRVRAFLQRPLEFDVASLTTQPDVERAMLILSYLGHAYVWGDVSPVYRLPASLARPWHDVAARLGRPPVLSYASYALTNWRRVDPNGPIALGNIVLLQNFTGGIDEEWFILVHVDIEARAGNALAAIGEAQRAVEHDQADAVEIALGTMARALEGMYQALARMPEHCDPHVYYRRVRPYIHGWKNNPALPDGLIYEGAFAGTPQQFAGETGAQSTIIPALDAALGVCHRDDPLRPYLLDMRNYMPPRHRAFLAAIEAGPSIRDYVYQHRAHEGLREAYNTCITWIERFRSRHLGYAADYVFKQAQSSPANPTTIGTGSTPFLPYLRKHRDETAESLIRGPADGDG
jgi:indoleamine 2,3-dioxygenase